MKDATNAHADNPPWEYISKICTHEWSPVEGGPPAEIHRLIGQAPSAIAIFDRDMRFVATSPRYSAEYNLPSDIRLIGRSYYDIFPDTPERWRHIHRRVLTGATAWEVEDPFTRADGSTEFITWMMTPWRRADGRIDGALLYSSVVTDRVRARRALAASEARYRALVRATSTIIWSCAASGVNVEPQPEWMAFTGQTKEAMRGDGWLKVVHPEDVARVASRWRAAVANGAPFTDEHRIRRRDGMWRWVHVSAAPVRNDRGDVVSWFGRHSDITGRKEAEQRAQAAGELVKREAWLSFALEAASAGVWQWHIPTGEFVWSPENYALYDIDPKADGPSYADWEARVHPDDRAQLDEAIGAVVAGRQPSFGSEFRIVRRDGTVRWLKGLGRVERDDNGHPLFMRGINLDITERKETEDRTFHRLVARSPFGVLAVDSKFALIELSQGAHKIFPNARSLIGRDFAEVARTFWPEPFASRLIQHFHHTLETGESYHTSESVTRWSGMDAEERYDCQINRHVLPDGRFGIICHVYDLSAEQRHEAHVRALMREVSHRSKNLLSLVQAIARQTVSMDPTDFVARFSERVRALAAAQDLLVTNQWRAVAVNELVRSQLSHFTDLINRRIRMAGPHLLLSAAATEKIGMALHELATNAAKYGALSNSSGSVFIAWNVAEGHDGQRQFTLSWAEQGGPTVTAPTRHGFGSTVTSEMLEYGLGGKVRVDYASDGLKWRFTCAVDDVIGSR